MAGPRAVTLSALAPDPRSPQSGRVSFLDTRHGTEAADRFERFTATAGSHEGSYIVTIHVAIFFSFVKDGVAPSLLRGRTAELVGGGGMVRSGETLPEPDALLVDKGGEPTAILQHSTRSKSAIAAVRVATRGRQKRTMERTFACQDLVSFGPM